MCVNFKSVNEVNTLRWEGSKILYEKLGDSNKTLRSFLQKQLYANFLWCQWWLHLLSKQRYMSCECELALPVLAYPSSFKIWYTVQALVLVPGLGLFPSQGAIYSNWSPCLGGVELADPIPLLHGKVRQLHFHLCATILMMSTWNTYVIGDAILTVVYKSSFVLFWGFCFCFFTHKTQRDNSPRWLYKWTPYLTGKATVFADGPYSCQALEDSWEGMLHWSPRDFVFLLTERLAGVCQQYIII